jgi:ketosteroid isomerase-like protein
VSENLDLARSIIGDWERGDILTSAEWAHPDIECVMVDGPVPSRRTGLAGMARITREIVSAYEDFSVTAQEYREIDERHVLVLVQFRGRTKTSGLELGQIAGRNASLLHIEFGTVTRLALYWDRDRAFADLGLKE